METIVSPRVNSYNTLLPIAAANRALAELGEEKIVGNLLSVIQRFGMEEKLGIRLLHKHNDISADEIMHESAYVDVEGFALTTKAVSRRHAVEVAANSWQLVGTEYLPVEFSDPPLVNSSNFNLAEHAEVLRELAAVLREAGAENLLGPCLHYGAYVDSQAPYLKSAFLEKTDFEDRANIVRFVELGDPAFTNSAKTKWRAVQVTDEAGNQVWTTACNCFCSVFPQGGHQGTKTHRYTP